MARGCRRFGGAARLGICAGLRFRAGLSRLPYSNDWVTLCEMTREWVAAVVLAPAGRGHVDCADAGGRSVALGRRTLREAGARRRSARRRLRGRVLWTRRSGGSRPKRRRCRSRRSIRRPPLWKPTSPRRASPHRSRPTPSCGGCGGSTFARQVAAMRARLGMLQGKKLTFDEESLALYDAVAPVKPESEFHGGAQTTRGAAARRGRADRSLRCLQTGIRDPQGAPRSRVPAGDSELPATG